MVSSQDPFNENLWVHLSDRIAAKRVGNAVLAVPVQRARYSVPRAMGNEHFALGEEL